jgi:hypothetical protein
METVETREKRWMKGWLGWRKVEMEQEQLSLERPGLV